MSIVVLISSVGRRSQLIECVRQSAKALNKDCRILGVDCALDAPGAYLVDQFIQVPRCSDSSFIPTMLRICEENHVLLVVPTIDTELAAYSKHRKYFDELGTNVAVSFPQTIEICSDKVCTHKWLVQNGFPTVRQASSEAFLRDGAEWAFPVIAKPRWGSASQGVGRVTSREMLRDIVNNRNDMIVQEIALGHEHTVNVLVDKNGRCVCAVPHRRLEVRAGEVSKGITHKYQPLIDLATKVAERLPGAYGALNIQVFLADSGEMQITEINARFGGGYPLAHRAGADFPRWILEETLGMPPSASTDQWEDGLTMLRYDDAVFVPAQK
jgi:carbamoyl-phosphate synthase large subunit